MQGFIFEFHNFPIFKLFVSLQFKFEIFFLKYLKKTLFSKLVKQGGGVPKFSLKDPPTTHENNAKTHVDTIIICLLCVGIQKGFRER